MMPRIRLLVGFAALFAWGAASAQTWEALPTVAPAPADNPTTPAKITLGAML